MADINLQHKILNQTRNSLDQLEISSDKKDELIQILSILMISLERYTPKENLEAESRMLAESLVSSHALLALVKQQADELDALKELSLALTSSLDLPTVLDAVAQEALRLVPNARTSHIFLYVDDKLKSGASLTSSGIRNSPSSEPRQNGLTYTVARRGETIIAEDVKKHELYQKDHPDWSGSVIGIPLKMDEKVVGVMNISRSSTGGFSPSELRLIGLLADQAAVAIFNASLHQLISEKAYSDTVTGLPNRRALDERLDTEIKSAWRTGTIFAVIMMDLDGFKQVNDMYGHGYGDQILRVVFNTIATSIRGTDFLARYGGDELTLILSQSSLSATRLVTNKIIENVRNFSPATPDNKPLKLGISGGIAVYPMHGHTASELLRAADASLYEAKKHHRGCFILAKTPTGPLGTKTLKK